MKEAILLTLLHVRRNLLFLLLSLLCAAILSSCQMEEGEMPVPVGRVILVYMGGDNNLSGEVEQKMAAVTAGFESEGSYSDRILLFSDTNGQEPMLTEIYRDRKQTTVHTRLIKTYDGYDSAEGATLAEVVSDVQSLYPNARYGLVVFSHASGWLPRGMYLNPLLPPVEARSRSIIRDGDNEMEISELAAALPDGMFDYIVFETCFMAGVETAYCLRSKTPLMVVSSAEIVSPGFTEVYPMALGYLLSGDAEGFARAAFAIADTSTGWRRSATYSVIRTEALEPLKRFVAEHADFGTQVDVFDVQRFDRNAYRLFFDLEDYYERLLATPALRAELSRLIARCVVWKAATPEFMTGHGGFTIARHSGLTAYIPQPEFGYLNRVYAGLAWNH